MTWNAGGYGQIPFSGIAAGSWNAGGYSQAAYGGLPTTGWNAGGYGQAPFDATPPSVPRKTGGGSVITPPWNWVPFTPVHPRRARRRRHEEIVLL